MMKKIFWTSIVRIALFGIFLLYMKWFNQQLAIWISDFIVRWEKNIEIELIDEEQENDETIEPGNDKTIEQENITIETNNDVLSDWKKLFEQLDRIESSIENSETLENNTKTWASQEEMFDEFKLWYEKNKK